MAAQDAFTQKEWEIIKDTPVSAGLAVILCDYGSIGRILELASLVSQLQEIGQKYPSNELIGTLFSDKVSQISEAINKRKKNIKDPARFIEQTLEQISLAIKILSAKACPSEVEEYKQCIYLCGARVAQAAGEGLFCTGKKVSLQEAQLLREIKTALNLSSLDFLSSLDLNENVSTIELLKFLFGADRWLDTVHGIFFVVLFSLAAYHISSFEIIQTINLGPVIVGLLLGAVYANTLGQTLPPEWSPGINFCKKKVLNLAIIFYGIKLTFQDLTHIGLSGLLGCFCLVVSTLLIAVLLGKYWFKLDDEQSLLIAAGTSICGSAAILATGSILKSKSYKSIIAVAITFLFGTVGMFILPLVYKLGLLPFREDTFGIFIGAIFPSVGNVAAAGSAVSEVVEKNAIIMKMMRVIMLVPFLLLLGIYTSRTSKQLKDRGLENRQPNNKIVVPWFAILFLVMIGINSLVQPSPEIVGFINSVDKFGFTMAMTALGIETSSKKVQGVGFKPLYLGLVLSIWLIVAGTFLIHMLDNLKGLL